MQEKLIARVGLCAAAAVFATSLGVLILAGARGDATPVRSMTPAQIQSNHTATQTQLTGARASATGI